MPQQEIERQEEEESAEELIVNRAPAERRREPDVRHPQNLRREGGDARFCQPPDYAAQEQQAGALREESGDVKGKSVGSENRGQHQPVGIFAQRPHVAVSFGSEQNAG
jgi:hypothetical protein